MSFPHCVAALAMATLSLTAVAQQIYVPPNPADAGVPVPPVSYQSAFKNYQPSRETQETPDQVWRATNDEMGKLGGHMGHIKDEPPSPSASQAPTTAARHQMHH
ncbi:MAG TPA: hypothetical protein VJ654_19230 [Noviherbaspirillum sp.]|nr:hypothetical protein [Noviherbaspirillum sp.]